jgi:uncharacterized membrane protein YeaQ/YmgE (transglycosylase-associated protein family)
MITFDVGQLFVWIMTGALLGFIIARMVRGWGFRTLTNVFLGVVGGVIGGGLLWFLSRYLPDQPLMRFTFTAADIIAAAVSAVILLTMMQFIRRAS